MNDWVLMYILVQKIEHEKTLLWKTRIFSDAEAVQRISTHLRAYFSLKEKVIGGK